MPCRGCFSFFEDSKRCVDIKIEESELLKVKEGIRQECRIRELVKLMSEAKVREVKREREKIVLKGGVYLRRLLFTQKRVMEVNQRELESPKERCLLV